MADQKRARRKPKSKAEETIAIDITPPELAPKTVALKNARLFADKETRPTPEQLGALPWFRQDEAYQVGYHMTTRGLREVADHPEFELCNVPGVLIEAAGHLLNQIADRVIEGERFAAGETVVFTGGRNNFLEVVAFREVKAGRLLRVVFLY
jgi:hypothetical protein